MSNGFCCPLHNTVTDAFTSLFQGRCWARSVDKNCMESRCWADVCDLSSLNSNPSPPYPRGWPLSWVKQVVALPEDKMLALRGIDATLYARFLRGCCTSYLLHSWIPERRLSSIFQQGGSRSCIPSQRSPFYFPFISSSLKRSLWPP